MARKKSVKAIGVGTTNQRRHQGFTASKYRKVAGFGLVKKHRRNRGRKIRKRG